MSYFDSQKEDPWASSFGSSAPAYSFGEQPAAPEPSFAAPQPDFSAPQPSFTAPQPAFVPQPETPQQALQPAFPTQQPDTQAPSFAPPQPNFASLQAAYASPQTIQAKVRNKKRSFFTYLIFIQDFEP